jgi:hypothetical protein
VANGQILARRQRGGLGVRLGWSAFDKLEPIRVVPLDARRRAVAPAEQVLQFAVGERQPLEVHPPSVRPHMARIAAVRVAELPRPEPEIVDSLSHRGGVHLRDWTPDFLRQMVDRRAYYPTFRSVRGRVSAMFECDVTHRRSGILKEGRGSALGSAQGVRESLHELDIFGQQEKSSARDEDADYLLGGRSGGWSILGEDLDLGQTIFAPLFRN